MAVHKEEATTPGYMYQLKHAYTSAGQYALADAALTKTGYM